MNQQIVVDTASGQVKRMGYCDFTTDGTFDPATETILAEGVDYRRCDIRSVMASLIYQAAR